MRWSFSLGRIAGTEIKVHLTFLLVLALQAFSAYRSGGAAAAIGSTLFVLALFLCVLLHEFGHVLMARRFGVRTPDILLLPIGGVARLERIPEAPRQELLVALAGPAVTLVVAGVLYALVYGAGLGGSVADLAQLNTLLLLFNLIPAFPMDGGRVLRAVLSSRVGLQRATRVAAGIGQLVAVAMGIAGLVMSPPNPILLLIAFFVFLGAGAELAAVQTRVEGRGITVTQMMVTDFRSIAVYSTLAEATALLLAGEQREFPVVDNWGHVEGVLTRDDLIRGLSERGGAASVADSMTTGAPAVYPAMPFEEALGRLRASRLRALPVVDAAGKLVGLLTMDNITDLLLVRRAQGIAG
jgi:Zn-dependent protease/CBS domain-containing protein